MANLKNTTINDTGFLQLPAGSDAQRPTGATGMIRINMNQTPYRLEIYQGGAWRTVEYLDNMAHFAEIDENNIVLRVIVIPDEQEDRGQEFCADDLQLGGTWLKTSYNTWEGEHKAGGTPYRLNYAVPGGYYDPELDGFIPPQPLPSFILDPVKGKWNPPVPKPADTEDATYIWDESIINWKPTPL